MQVARHYGYDISMLQTTRETDRQTDTIYQLISEHF